MGLVHMEIVICGIADWLTLFAGSDSLIGLSYVAISGILAYFVYKTHRDLPFPWVFIAFGIFIIACGSTHFLDVLTIWVPVYVLSGMLRFMTAVASAMTAVMLPLVLPRVFALIAAANVSEVRKRQLEQAHCELESLYEQSKELDRLKTNFFANVSHELRTPLTLILGPIKDLLAQETVTNQHHRTLRIVERNAGLLLRRINDLLDITRLEAGKMELTLTHVDLVHLVQGSAAYFEALAEQRQMMVSIEAPHSVLAMVDREKFERIFFNLFSNALKFTPSGGQIRCAFSSEGEWGIITFQDTGPGIPPELRQPIFERFQQGSSEQASGTGLGLAIVKEFVELHGGTIEVDEAPGGGARFTTRVPLLAPFGAVVHPLFHETLSSGITLPGACASEEQERLEATRASGEEEDAHARILVIEDNQEMAQYLASVLVSDYHVTLVFLIL